MCIDHMHGYMDALALIVEKMGAKRLAGFYGVRLDEHAAADSERAAHAILANYARAKRKILQEENPDECWSAREILKDYVEGVLLHCEEPPAKSEESVNAEVKVLQIDTNAEVSQKDTDADSSEELRPGVLYPGDPGYQGGHLPEEEHPQLQSCIKYYENEDDWVPVNPVTGLTEEDIQVARMTAKVKQLCIANLKGQDLQLGDLEVEGIPKGD